MIKIKINPHHFFKPVIDFNEGCMGFTKIDNPVKRYNGRNKFIITENTFKGALIQHPPVIKDLSPPVAAK